MTEATRCCATCASWSNVEPTLATGIRRAAGSDVEIGICRRLPPVVLATAGIVMTRFPEIHYARVCDDWASIDESDPDGGERAPIGGDVVPLRAVA